MNAMAQPDLVREFLEYRDVLLGFLCSLTRDPDAAEEVLQNVGLAVVAEAGRGTRVVDFRRWVREIARHRAADYYRERSRARTLPVPSESMMAVVCQSYDERDIDLEGGRLRQKYLLDCLKNISGRAREAIERRYRDRLSPSAIAAAMGWQASSVAVALSRARRVLHDCIQSKLRRGEATQHG
jgi:RNA polymerase sigma-70 factor, ECF subfamily